MKKALVLLLFLLLPIATAISTDMKEVYQPGETLIIEIKGNILEPIQKEDIEFKRKNVQVAFNYDVKKLGERYFLYALLREFENNYTLHINDVSTTLNGQPQKIDFQQNFSTSGDLVPYSINPGFIITKNDFEIQVFLNKDEQEIITVSFPEEYEAVLNPGNNEITFSSEGIEPGFYNISIGTYTLPIFILPQEISAEPQPRFRFFPEEIESVVLVNEEIKYPFRIINIWDRDLENLIFEYDQDIFVLEPEPITFLGINETAEFNLSLKQMNQHISKNILVYSGDVFIELPVDITFTENREEAKTDYLDENNYEQTQDFYCGEKGGIFCSAEETCSEETVNTLDGSSCCLGICSAEETETSFAWIGYLIGAFLLIVAVIILGRYLKSKKRGDPLLKKL